MTRHITVLDDSRFVLAQTRAVLESHGYRVSCFADPEQLDPSTLEDAALVLVDVHMREVFGDDVISFLKESMGVRAPVVLFSSIPEAELARRASASGADGYVVKGADVAEQVERYLGGRDVQ